jgi:hypothetical protein
VTEAAKVQLAGMSAWQFLTVSDSTERLLTQAVTEQVFKLMDQREENQAQRIANCVAKLFGGN